MVMEPATCMAALCIEPWSLLQVATKEGSKSFERKENHFSITLLSTGRGCHPHHDSTHRETLGMDGQCAGTPGSVGVQL